MRVLACSAPLQGQRSEQTTTFSRLLRESSVGRLLNVVTDRKMKLIQGRRPHAVKVFAEAPGCIIDFPILEFPQGDF